jgi:acyl carrier protein
MDRQEITDKIVNVIKELVGVESVDPKGNVLDQPLALDSLDIVELDMRLEEEFNIDIPDDDMFDQSKESLKYQTPEDLAGYIEGRLNA